MQLFPFTYYGLELNIESPISDNEPKYVFDESLSSLQSTVLQYTSVMSRRALMSCRQLIYHKNSNEVIASRISRMMPHSHAAISSN